ncbi:D111/g-patch domain-containing protein [Quillaja saponaria]|uniref:D111/g-patch domain-containing protein n=1 Tax=Quillaja saponaria TaxID=32244 RepID=A0AAD7KUH0_QUISA|nr:D111/g-patch domain-containing protein [Quillaja saponaria]
MEANSRNSENNDSVFVWDEKSQLYFHASSGFYHDPNAGWYYSSKDGQYYKFEDGNYVLLSSDDKGDDGETNICKEISPQISTQDGTSMDVDNNDDKNYPPFPESEFEAYQQIVTNLENAAHGSADCTNSPACENPLPPPSEWLEDTLIDLYLSGYTIPAVNTEDAVTMPSEIDRGHNSLSTDVNCDAYELEEGEWIPEDDHAVTDTRNLSDEGPWDEENWRSQYGQVIESGEGPVPEFPVVNLWDWEMVIGSKRDGKGKVARLVGRLVKRSAKLHPSMPSGSGILRSAPICEVRLDLVRVKTGQVYKLRNPSARYLASLSTYDSANPTKDWGFRELSFDRKIPPLSKSNGTINLTTAHDASMSLNELSSTEKNQHKSHVYRDRAAERRMLHGGFGVGPGQKNSASGDNDMQSSYDDVDPQEAAAEALNMSFGSGSYARKILESMGWKEGEGLGNTTKGLVEPILAVGNTGNAGLGWPQGRAKHY